MNQTTTLEWIEIIQGINDLETLCADLAELQQEPALLSREIAEAKEVIAHMQAQDAAIWYGQLLWVWDAFITEREFREMSKATTVGYELQGDHDRAFFDSMGIKEI